MILSVVQKESFYDCLAEPPGFRHGEHQLEEFFIYNNIDIDFDNENNTCTMTFEDKKYQVETVELINRHGDDLCDEMVLQLHTLKEI